ncbi:hypothetical protein [Endozoicomonas sp. ONNA2]|uniref:hypothetical protein n=1 Tax=Endozoicomonas sp. ONNA2 TaxID=2828741 RepID=UPI0021472B90|nr:hypothetical protein [Endozoicomonas sp. ONNA2]
MSYSDTIQQVKFNNCRQLMARFRDAGQNSLMVGCHQAVGEYGGGASEGFGSGVSEKCSGASGEFGPDVSGEYSGGASEGFGPDAPEEYSGGASGGYGVYGGRNG